MSSKAPAGAKPRETFSIRTGISETYKPGQGYAGGKQGYKQALKKTNIVALNVSNAAGVGGGTNGVLHQRSVGMNGVLIDDVVPQN